MDDSGQMASTIWVDVSTRLSTKLTFRSLWRIKDGGQPVRVVEPVLLRRGFCRSSAGTASCCRGSGCLVQGLVNFMARSAAEAVAEVDCLELQ
jgi:hypothetical protein